MKKKVSEIIALLEQKYPEAPCALHYSKDYELMIAVRLSAQCTDARVNLITPTLFATYPTLEDMANADIAKVRTLSIPAAFSVKRPRILSLPARCY
jgi:endonuclease-3